MQAGKNRYFFVESLVFALVIFSALGIYSHDVEDTADDLHLNSLTGSIELATRDSMDVFGLQDFDVGAIADLQLSVSYIDPLACVDCATSISGIILNGDVVITNLIDQQGRLGRVEGSLNFTHLVTYSTSNFIQEEQVNFQWVAGEISSSWALTVKHNPPRWLPEYDLNTIFIETEQGLEARSGPELLIKTPTENRRIIHACLPDSFLCRNSAADAVIVATYTANPDLVVVEDLIQWGEAELSVYMPTNSSIDTVSQVISVGDLVTNDYGYLPSSSWSINNVSSYTLDDNTTMLSPLSSWFNSLDMTSLEFAIGGEKLVWISGPSGNVYNLVNLDGDLRMGLIVY